MIEQKLVSPAQAAAVLGIGRTKFYELIAAGEIRVIRIGRAVRIPLLALDEWIQRKSNEGTTGMSA